MTIKYSWTYQGWQARGWLGACRDGVRVFRPARLIRAAACACAWLLINNQVFAKNYLSGVEPPQRISSGIFVAQSECEEALVRSAIPADTISYTAMSGYRDFASRSGCMGEVDRYVAISNAYQRRPCLDAHIGVAWKNNGPIVLQTAVFSLHGHATNVRLILSSSRQLVAKDYRIDLVGWRFPYVGHLDFYADEYTSFIHKQITERRYAWLKPSALVVSHSIKLASEYIYPSNVYAKSEECKYGSDESSICLSFGLIPMLSVVFLIGGLVYAWKASSQAELFGLILGGFIFSAGVVGVLSYAISQ